MKGFTTKRILGYTRSGDRGGRVVSHHINEVANAVCVARRDNTQVYVIEYEEVETEPQEGRSDGDADHAEP